MTRLRQFFLPLLVLAAMLCVTWLVWDHEQQNTRKALRSQFDFLLRETVSRFEQRMAGYEQMLRGVQGLFAATEVLNRNNFRNYIDSLQLDANFSAIQAIGVIEKPKGRRETYAPVIQVEPSIGSNRTLLGLDQWPDPVRRSAMEKARDSGMPAISGILRLATDNKGNEKAGFIMYLPIYAKGQQHDSESTRRTHLTGWVFASFHMHDLVASLYGEQLPGLAMAIYDGVEPSATSLLYSSLVDAAQPQTSTIAASEYLVFAGHTWMLSMSTLDDFDARFGRNAKLLIVTTGTSLSLILALLAWLLANGRARAMRLATTMTGELHKKIDEYQVAQALLQQAKSAAESANSRIIKQSEVQERFLEMVSHEYRTPLAIIQANIDIMELKEQQSGLGLSKSLNNIQHAVGRLVDIFEATQRRNGFESMPLNPVFEVIDAEQSLRQTVAAATILWGERFICVYDLSVGLLVNVDSRLMRTAILNLLDNATKYSSPDIPITMQISNGGDWLELTIRNHPSVELHGNTEILFQKFSRGPNSAGTSGTGQGLYLARSIVEQHGGSMELMLDNNGDVVAIMRLPLTSVPEEPNAC